LIGPSRAILFTDNISVEINLMVKGAASSQDLHLMCIAGTYTGWNGSGISSIHFRNLLCRLELCLQPVEQTVQATILGVQVAGSWPFKYGGLVSCYPICNDDPSCQIVLIASTDKALPQDKNGYLHLWRQVVSVDLEGRLDFVIKSYSECGEASEEVSVPFYPELGEISKKRCLFGEDEVTFTVAWSYAVARKT
jgi:hypothetical protein